MVGVKYSTLSFLYKISPINFLFNLIKLNNRTDAVISYHTCGRYIKLISNTTQLIISQGSIVKSASGEYVQLFTMDEICNLLGMSSGAISDPMSIFITTYNGDASAANNHFYNCEYWGSPYNAFYQYFYPSKSGAIRINFRIEYFSSIV